MISTTFVAAFILILCRMTSFFSAVPVFFPKGMPNLAKIGFSVVITYILMPMIDISNISENISLFGLFVFSIYEIIIGLTLGYLTNLCFSFARMAGQLMDFHVGFSMSSMFDPTAEDTSTLIGRILFWLSLMIFLLIDGHHMLIQSLLRTFETVQIGTYIMNGDTISYIIRVFVEFFEIGIKISIPITLILLITNLVLGLASRSVPQLNVMILGMPIKILVGLGTLTLTFPMIIKLVLKMFENIPVIFDNFFYVVPFVFVLADSGGEKTEDATPKKKADAKKKGQVAKSKELSQAFTLIAATSAIALFGGYAFNSLKELIQMFYNDYLTMNLNYSTINGIFQESITRILKIFLPIVLPIMVMGVLSNYLQTGFILTGEPLKPDLKKLNPISGMKKLFSVKALVTLVKDISIVSVVGYVGYSFIIKNYNDILKLGEVSLGAVPAFLSKFIVDIFFKISFIMLAIAILDFAFQKYQHKKDLRMSKQEIKEEFKQSEGDPQIKSRIKQTQREMAMKRMMQSVPDATVVVTNPTHIAIALKYEDGTDEAPKLLAKGADNIAIKIKEVAKKNDVPIIENKPLARMIYSQVEIDREIPSEMYQAVAEILAVVYRLKKK